MPWLHVKEGRVWEEAKKHVDTICLSLGGRVFFQSVDPIKSRAKAPRRGWSELVSELVSFAKQVHALAALWKSSGEVVENVSKAFRKISGFVGKEFIVKDIRAASNMPVL